MRRKLGHEDMTCVERSSTYIRQFDGPQELTFEAEKIVMSQIENKTFPKSLKNPNFITPLKERQYTSPMGN